jgi:hypothetical protein
LGGITFTPYFLVEWDEPMDNWKYYSIFVLDFGLNFKPTSSVALKLEGSRNKWVMQFADNVATVWTVASQLAVSF